MRLVELEPQKPLSLTTDGALELFFIGVGSAFSREHFNTNLLLIKGQSHLLVDFGITGPTALWQTARIHPAMIENILPTHSHDDHIGGLGHLALASRYIGVPFMKRPRPRLVATVEYRELLWERSLRGNLEWNEMDRAGKGLGLEDYFDFITPQPVADRDRPTWTVTLGDLTVEFFRTRHIPEQAKTLAQAFFSLGLYADGVFFSGDSQFDPELVKDYAGRGARCFFHDVQFFPGAVHAPLADLRTLPPGIRERMWLVHYADTWRDQAIDGFAGWTRQGVRYRFD